MSQEQLYPWWRQIARFLPCLSKWQALALALFSLGVVVAERCTLSKVAEKLLAFGKADSIERRLQRFVSNAGVDLTVCGPWWTRWVISCLDSEAVILLVDETKLADHLGIVMVGLAYRCRCIPLAWRCYAIGAYPTAGQVQVIAALLDRVQAGLPEGCRPLIQADRGIGTSPDLVREVEARGWSYLFRVQNNTRLLTRQGREHPLHHLIKPGESWSGHGLVFKKDGWRIDAYVLLHWDIAHREPWCLITNDPDRSAHAYALRNWQEQGFRDLKSGGWQWQRSQVWQPDHADRLVLVLALAYAWTLTQGTLLFYADPPTRLCITRGSQRIYSLFREGLRYVAHRLHHDWPLYLGLFFAPDKPPCLKLS
jgi:hypothetical protein